MADYNHTLHQPQAEQGVRLHLPKSRAQKLAQVFVLKPRDRPSTVRSNPLEKLKTLYADQSPQMEPRLAPTSGRDLCTSFAVLERAWGTSTLLPRL
jgi:hypothetical protein